MSATAISPAVHSCETPQHLQALQRANRVRLARAQLKREIGAGAVRVDAVVLACPWEAESMAIADLLMSQPRWGRTRCRRFLATLLITESKTIGTLTVRQRHAVAEALLDTEVSPRNSCSTAVTSTPSW